MDEEIRRFLRELGVDNDKREWIERLRRRIEELRRRIGVEEEELQRILANPHDPTWRTEEAREKAIEEAVKRIGRLRRGINHVLERAPRLARIAGLLGEGTAHAAQLAGKALRLVGHALIPIDIILFIVDNPSNIAVPYMQFDLVDTYLVTSSSGDEIHCYMACVYEHTHDVLDTPDSKLPPVFGTATLPSDEDLVIMREYPCDRPPDYATMTQACAKTFYVQAE